MSPRNSVWFLAAVLALAALLLVPLLWVGDPDAALGGGAVGDADRGAPLEAPAAAAAAPARLAADPAAERQGVGDRRPTGVRGRVIRAGSRQPVVDIEVLALRRPPSIERLYSRLTSMLQGGLWTQTTAPVEVLGRTRTDGAGRFELLGLPAGRVFLDGKSESAFVRTPKAVRLAAGEVAEGVELVASPGGRIQGVVWLPDGAPAAGAAVSVRPGLNAFFGQITQRKFRWLETTAGADGTFELAGVPTGEGYTVSAQHAAMALEEVHGVGVARAQTTRVTIRGHPGAELAGRVVDPDGAPVGGARLAFVYMDLSRVLFSADGRSEPWRSAADGSFRIPRIAAGRIGLIAEAAGLAPSPIEQLTVVDGGVYDGLTLVLDGGLAFTGRVTDDLGQPLAGAAVEIRPIEDVRDPDPIQYVLKIRNVAARSGADGQFRATGLSGDKLVVQTAKPGYATEVRFGVPLDQPFEVALARGATLRGVVAHEDGTPCRRFSVRARFHEVDENGATRRRPRGFGPARWLEPRTVRLAAGQQIGDRGLEDEWRDFESTDGTFAIAGLPPGRVRVRVHAEGFGRPPDRDVDLRSGAESEVLAFAVTVGNTVRGQVVEAATGAPVADAQVTARDADRRRGRGGGNPFRASFEPEDFDFLVLSTNLRQRSVLTDSQGRFEIPALSAGRYTITARHPDLAKASARAVTLEDGVPHDELRIELAAGGGVAGQVTGAGRRPLADAVIAALSFSAGAIKSASTDAAGRYEIDGLVPGQYVVFKSRLDERTWNLGYELLGNMRLKSATVRAGAVTRVDIHDEAEGTARVYGVVREGGAPVPRAMVSAVHADRDGVFGMGIRARPTDEQGRFELIGLAPGEYYFQVARFRSRPQQANLRVEVPDDVAELRVDLDLPESSLAGVVRDSDGQPLAGVRVQAGVEEGGIRDAPGLLGLILKNGIAQTRSAADGTFSIDGVAAGVYRLTASGRDRRGRSAAPTYGDAIVHGIQVDGRGAVTGIELMLPRAGRITGAVVDGNGGPVAGAEVHYARDGAPAESLDAGGIEDLFGVQLRPEKTGADGRFALAGVTPGTYRVRADFDGRAPGVAEDVVVVEGQDTDVRVEVVRGATLRIRVTNIDGTRLPAARVSVLDGQGKPLARNVSVLSVFRRLMKGRQKADDSGWYEVGEVPPDTYTVVVTEAGHPDLRLTRTVRDGESVAWDIDMTAELEASGRARK